ncbi:MAG: hypothetical protein GY867_00530 [bacterium]|nr:hypothetical protein [bacterium]
MNRYGAAVLTAMLGLTPCVSKAISVSQSIDRTDMRFEDTAAYQVVISWEGPPTRYRFEKALRLEADKLKVASFSSTVNSTGTGSDEISSKVVNYRLVPTGSGTAGVESLAIEFMEWPDTTVGVLLTDAFAIAVARPVPIKALDQEGNSIWLWSLAVVVLLGGAAGVVVWMRGKEEKPPVRTPAQAFLDDLATLKSDTGSDLKQFQTGLYKILTVFVSVLYQIDVNGRSTEAILDDLEKADLSREGKDMLSDWLRRAEREKYAPVNAAPGETIRLESEIRNFVEKHF